MLKINQFYWNLYKNSPEGRKVIEKFERALKEDFSTDESISLFKEFDPDWFLNVDDSYAIELFEGVHFNQFDWNNNVDLTPRKKAEDFIARVFGTDYVVALSRIVPLSFYLFQKEPSYFIPYMFLQRYKYIRQVLEDYDLDILEVPGKSDIKDRFYYYLDICDALSQFRKLNGLTGPELCAFLYGMERGKYDSDNLREATPFPQVWLISGSKKTFEEANKKILFWHGNPNTKKGDILVFYENRGTYYRENDASITGIWTALADGISDPLFYYYGEVMMGNEVKVKPIPFKVLKNDQRTNKLPRIGANFLGVGGDPVSTKVYEGLLDLIEERDPSFDRGLLPKLHEPFTLKVRYDDVRGIMKPEKWVEEYLIKEMLEKMGWHYKIDYDRQVHLQLGRAKVEGEKTQDGRTDFSLFPFGRRLKCADVLIEAKAPGEMDGKDIEIAFWQAESYASRQYAGLIILADGEKILLFPKSKDGTFKYSNNPESYTWNEIFANTNDKFIKLRNTIASYRKH